MPVSAQIPAGVVSKLEGTVRVIRADGKSAGSLKVGDALRTEDVVLAELGARLQLTNEQGQVWESSPEALPAGESVGVSGDVTFDEARKTLLAQIGRAHV